MTFQRLAGMFFACGALLLACPVGCRSTQRDTTTQPAARDGELKMEHTMADSDAERATAALERNSKTGERRPATPKRRPVVDQPRSTR